MKLLAKFNLMLLVIFGAGGLLICQLAYNFLIRNARRVWRHSLLTVSTGRLASETCSSSQLGQARPKREARLQSPPTEISFQRLPVSPGN